jgi:hypothetical protein
MLPDRLSVVGVEETIVPSVNDQAVPEAAPIPKSQAPSTNGVGGNGKPAEDPRRAARKSPSTNGFGGAGPQPSADRDADGRFAKGNPGGPGNPYARQVAALRREALAAVTPDDIHAIIAKMIELARAGDVAAAKLVLGYAVGRPAPAPTLPSPDRLAEDEWQGFKDTAPMTLEAQGVLMPNPDAVLTCVRAGRYARTREFAGMAEQVFGTPPKEVPALLRKMGRRLKKKYGR